MAGSVVMLYPSLYKVLSEIGASKTRERPKAIPEEMFLDAIGNPINSRPPAKPSLVANPTPYRMYTDEPIWKTLGSLDRTFILAPPYHTDHSVDPAKSANTQIAERSVPILAQCQANVWPIRAIRA